MIDKPNLKSQILSQAESRAHRIGQENQVTVKYLLAPGTADDSIWPLLLNKQKILEEIGLSKDSFNNVAVNKQDSTNGESLAECLNTGVTSANTLDITTYFKSPGKIRKCEEESIVSDSAQMDLFNDDFDEIVSNINLDF